MKQFLQKIPGVIILCAPYFVFGVLFNALFNAGPTSWRTWGIMLPMVLCFALRDWYYFKKQLHIEMSDIRNSIQKGIDAANDKFEKQHGYRPFGDIHGLQIIRSNRSIH